MLGARVNAISYIVTLVKQHMQTKPTWPSPTIPGVELSANLAKPVLMQESWVDGIWGDTGRGTEIQ